MIKIDMGRIEVIPNDKNPTLTPPYITIFAQVNAHYDSTHNLSALHRANSLAVMTWAEYDELQRLAEKGRVINEAAVSDEGYPTELM